MRLGGFYSAERTEDLEALCEQLDTHGLSVIPAPNRIAEMSDEECVAFGEAARALGLVIGETGMWENLMTSDPVRRAERIERVRALLVKAELMECRCVISLVGSGHPADSMLAPDGSMLTDAGRHAFREVVLRIVDGLDLTWTSYAIEPWRTSFFYRPEEIRAFLDEVDRRCSRASDFAGIAHTMEYDRTDLPLEPMSYDDFAERQYAPGPEVLWREAGSWGVPDEVLVIDAKGTVAGILGSSNTLQGRAKGTVGS